VAVEVPPPQLAVPVAPEMPVEAAEPVSPAHARLGSEALGRLRGRYADVLANIARRVPDELRREQLREQAARLNPDNWVTDQEVTAGLESYESVLASLREVVGRRRRRRRGRGASDAVNPGAPDAPEAQPGQDSGEGEPEDDGEGAEADPLKGS
jgi:hypothetical protein